MCWSFPEIQDAFLDDFGHLGRPGRSKEDLNVRESWVLVRAEKLPIKAEKLRIGDVKLSIRYEKLRIEVDKVRITVEKVRTCLSSIWLENLQVGKLQESARHSTSKHAISQLRHAVSQL